MPIAGDLRAWDAVITLAGRRAGCEAETAGLTDIQALERRLALKLRDGDVDVLILVVADTATIAPFSMRIATALRRCCRSTADRSSRRLPRDGCPRRTG